MNMIFNSPSVAKNGTTLEDKASAKKSALAKLVSAWEAKQKSAKKFGGFGLLAVTLAACNNDDDDAAGPSAAVVDTTPYDQAYVDAQVAAATAAVDTTADDAAATNTAVAAATAFANLDALVAAYNAATNSGDVIMSTGIDYSTGSATDDTFVAVQTAGADSTWGVADEIDGAGGTDTLKLTVAQAAAINAGTVLNVENMIIRQTDATGNNDLNMANFPSVTNLTIDRPAAGNDTTGIALTDTLTVKDMLATTNSTLTYGGVLTGTADAASATLSGSTAGAQLDFSGAVETMSVTTVGITSMANLVFDNATTTVNLDAGGATTVATTWTGAGVTALNITGAGLTKITPDLGAATATVTASGSTGGVDIDFGNVAEATPATTITDVTFTGSAAADTLDIATVDPTREVQISMGAGNDTVILAAEVAADTTDLIDGGDGNDTIQYTASATLDATHETQVTNFETLKTGGTATITMANLDNFTAQNFASSTADATGGGSNRVVVSLDGLLTGATFSADAAATAITRDAADVDGVEFNFSLTTDDTTATANDSITISVAESYEEVSDDAQDDFETITLNSTGGTAAAGNVIEVVDFGAAKTLTINGTGAGTLTLPAITALTTTDVVATGTTQAITPTFVTAVKSYAGGSGVDTVSLAAGGLTSAKTFTDAGGATDSLSVATTSAQNLGIINVTGYETMTITSHANAQDLTSVDMRNVSDVTDLNVAAGDATDNFTVTNIGANTVLDFGGAAAFNTVTTSITGTQTAMTVKASTDHGLVASLVLDAGVQTLTINSTDGDATLGEGPFIDITATTGTGLTKIIAIGDDLSDIGTVPATVKEVDASAMLAGFTMIGNATGTALLPLVIRGSDTATADSLTGGAGVEHITSGKGNDTIIPQGGADKVIFGANGTDNGLDTVTVVLGGAGDVLDFSAFLSAGTFSGAAGTALTAVAHNATSDIDITNKFVLLDDATGGANSNTVTLIAGLIDGAGDSFSIAAGGKAIVASGNDAGADTIISIFYVNDANGDGDVADANEVLEVMNSGGNLDLNTMITTNVDIVA